MRRTKREMSLMRDDAKFYLLLTNNNPHRAFEMMIKENLESGSQIPYYIKGVKDFIEASKDLALELNRTGEMRNKDRLKAEDDNKVRERIASLSLAELKKIYNEHKDIVRHSDKLNLHHVYFQVFTDGHIKVDTIDESTVRTFQRIF